MSLIGEVMKFQRKALAIAVMVATSTLSACSSDDIKEAIEEEIVAKISDVTLSANSVDENSPGAEIASLETNIDLVSDISFATENENFVISGTTLSLAEGYALDYEKEKTVTLTVNATYNSTTFSKELTIEVNDLLDYYGFMSKVGDETQSSVSYGGQAARHALIAELKHYIGNGGLQADLDNGVLTTKDAVIAKLNSFYNADENSWDGLNISFTTATQTKFSELSSSYKSLKDKVAGNDASGQHKLWNGESDVDGNYTDENIAFAGWGTKGSITPSGLIDLYFQQLADIAIDSNGGKRYAPGSEAVVANEIPVFVTDNGTDLNQLIQKFLLMSVAYSQAADDYLDEEKGLAATNVGQDKGTKDYTKLEHQFDEGFGYFGAARDYLSYNDNEISGKVSTAEDGREEWNGQHDTNGDGSIDLLSEKNFGNSVNAAKRDRGTKDNTAATDYTKQAMDAFLKGRQLISDNAGVELTEDQKTELLTYRDAALDAWERSVAGTVIHYINDLDADLAKVDTADFDYVTTAKHFSELKGFALGLQFNPYSPVTDVQFEEIHTFLKDAPVLNAADVAAYQADLKSARDILQAAYSFDATNVAGW